MKILGNGGKPNNPKTWIVRIVKTKKQVAYFRQRVSADKEKLKLERTMYQEYEVVENEEL